MVSRLIAPYNSGAAWSMNFGFVGLPTTYSIDAALYKRAITHYTIILTTLILFRCTKGHQLIGMRRGRGPK